MTTYSTAAEISADIQARLEAIRTADGSETDVGRHVFRGRRNVDPDMVPCASIIEGNDTPTDRPGRLPTVAIKQRYVIGCYVPCDPDHPNDAAHAAIRDIKRAIFKGNGTLDDRVRKVSYSGRDIGPRADGVPIVFAVVYLDVEYVEDLTNP